MGMGMGMEAGICGGQGLGVSREDWQDVGRMCREGGRSPGITTSGGWSVAKHHDVGKTRHQSVGGLRGRDQ